MCNRNCTVMGFIVSNQETDEGKRGEKEGGGEGEREEREMERGREREGGREERERLGRCCYRHSSLIIHSSRARVLILSLSYNSLIIQCGYFDIPCVQIVHKNKLLDKP